MGVLPSFLGVAVPIQNARVERRNMVAKHGVLSILKANHWGFLSRTPELDTSVNRGTWRKTEVVGRIIRIASPEERQLLEAGWLKDAERDSGTWETYILLVLISGLGLSDPYFPQLAPLFFVGNITTWLGLKMGYRKKSHGLSSLSLFFTLPFGALPNLQTRPNIRLIFPIQSKLPWNIPQISHSRWTNPWFPEPSFIPISRQWTVSFTRWSCGTIFRVTRFRF